MLRNVLVNLWTDEAGSVVATEYLMLASIVALGSAVGMAEVRDSMVDEYRELGQSVRETRQSFAIPGRHAGLAATAGSAAVNDPSTLGMPPVPTAPSMAFGAP